MAKFPTVPGHGETTGLEIATHEFLSDTVPRSREVLRGYSWVTVVPQEWGDRLGGLQALEASGAFVDVAQLDAGGYWLRATEHWRDYRLPAAERVFEVLAPVLPAGKVPGDYAASNVIVRRDPGRRR